MIAATNHPYRIARVCCSPSAPRLSKAGLSDSSPGRPATTFDDAQMYDGHRAGATRRFGARGCGRHTPAHRQGLAHVARAWNGRGFSLTALFPFDALTTNLPGLRSRRSLSFIGIGRRANAILASIQHGRQGTRTANRTAEASSFCCRTPPDLTKRPPP